jgi:hypothetical protein
VNTEGQHRTELKTRQEQHNHTPIEHSRLITTLRDLGHAPSLYLSLYPLLQG